MTAFNIPGNGKTPQLPAWIFEQPPDDADYLSRNLGEQINGDGDGPEPAGNTVVAPDFGRWPEPGRLPDGLPPVPALTPDMLPAAIRPWLADVAERMQCPLDFPAAGAVVAAGAVIGRQLAIRPKRHDDWTCVPNLWGMIVGRPGVMKSPSLREALRPVERIEKEAADAHLAAMATYKAGEKLREGKRTANKAMIVAAIKKRDDAEATRLSAELDSEPAAPTRARLIVNDSTVEKLGELLAANSNGLLLSRDELTGFLRSMEKQGRESDRAFFLEAWEGNGRFTYDRIARGTIDIEACCVSVLGGIQPGPLAICLTSAAQGGDGDDGLVQRFQIAVWPDVSANWINVDEWPNSRARNAYQTAFMRLADLDAHDLGAETDDFGGMPFVRFDDLAQDQFDAWRTELELRLRAGGLLPILESHLAKYRSLAPSLALIFQLLDGGTGRIGVRPLTLALRWCRYLEAHAGRVYSTTINADAHAARTLASHILAGDLGPSFSSRDVWRPQWSGLRDAAEAGPALDILTELGWLRATERHGTGGRPAMVYAVNPRVQKSARGGQS